MVTFDIFSSLHFFLFVIFPYIAIITCIIGCLYRYKYREFTYSALSYQFINNDLTFYIGMRLWHYSIFIIIFGHIFALIFTPAYVYIKETANSINPLLTLGWDISRIFVGITALIGLILLLYRRIVNSRVRAVSSFFDYLILVLFIVEVCLGLYIELSHSDEYWFTYVLAPWLHSLFTLAPFTPGITDIFVETHILIFFILVMLIPFTRLVHIFTYPVTYFWRLYQIIIWYNKPGRRPT